MKARKFVVTLAAGVAAAGLTAGAFGTANASTSATASSASFAPAAASVTQSYGLSTLGTNVSGKVTYKSTSTKITGTLQGSRSVQSASTITVFSQKNAKGKRLGTVARSIRTQDKGARNFSAVVPGKAQSIRVSVVSVNNGVPAYRSYIFNKG